ncbi:MAG: DUF302 domain-containing protein [Candidatus Kapaibacterium sp.]
MAYYYTTTVTGITFSEAIERVTAELQKEGFGVLTEIDVQATFKKKLDIDFRKYRILGACNPTFANKAITAEDKIGVFLPCNVVLQEHENGSIEITAVDPVASMMAVQNNALGDVAQEVQARLQKVIAAME